jgi:uncharacterized membrane protein YoaK (UPF0700 family)
MPLDLARRLMGRERTYAADQLLGMTLAFVAGATNAGAFLAVRQYTSHMTGIFSSLADAVVLHAWQTAMSAVGALLSFLLGAAVCALLVNFGHRRQWRSVYATPLLLEAVLMLLFGVLGARLAHVSGLFVPLTIILLCFMMGLQNAVITKISRSVIRTTHVTGMITDLGIEFGRLFYMNAPDANQLPVRADRTRMRLLASLLFAFFFGGVLGAVGFQRIGYAATIPLAITLGALGAVPAFDDLSASWHEH